MEAGEISGWNERYLNFPVIGKDGLWIDSLNRLKKGRMGAWQGVVTVPFVDPSDAFHKTLPKTFPWVTLYYKKTVGKEFRQYKISFRPEPGEDIGLAVGFDELQFDSNTRTFAGFLLEPFNEPTCEEIISRSPDSDPVESFLVPSGQYDAEEVRKQARDLAIGAYADRLKFPVALNGSPGLEAVFDEEFVDDGVLVRVYGLAASYNEITATQKSP